MDFHCHLDLYPNGRQIYSQALQRCDFTWLVTTSPKAYVATSHVLGKSEAIYITPGLHPEVAEKKAGELELLLKQIEQCVGIGEVGLDGSTQYRQSFAVQHHVFDQVVKRCANLGGRVLNIHSRAAASHVLDVLERHPGFGIALMHWFTDAPLHLKRAIEMGCWFSVGPAMLSSANGRKLASLMPRDRIVTESDGPFGKIRGASLMPWDAYMAHREIANLWGVAAPIAEAQLQRNGEKLIGFIREGL